MKIERRVPYDPSRASLYRPGQARDFFSRPGPLDRPALCAELSRLAYCDDPERRKASLAGGGLEERAFLDRDGTEVLVAGAGPVTYVAFRGTDDPKALVQDLTALPAPWNDGGRVHRGFAAHFERVRDDIAKIAKPEVAEVVFTGHSLGAAAATLATSLWPRAALYTFGSPRVGNKAFADALRGRRVERFVNCCDLVCRVPPGGLDYVHVGALRYLDRRGVLRSEPSEEEVRRDRRAAAWEYLVRYAPALFTNVLSRRLADHAPVNYVEALAGGGSQPTPPVTPGGR